MKKILFVCTGNICRSPTAEAVFRHMVEQEGWGSHFEIDSAGTHAYHVGEAPDRRATQMAACRGIDMKDLRARKVTDDDFHHFDYILAMDAGHNRILARRAPAKARAEISLFLEAADVPDPYYGGLDGFEQVLDMIEQGGATWLKRLKPEGFQ